jgi:hypothetical protein
MFKFIVNLFKIEHVHCFCDKKHDIIADNGDRIVIMACNKCGKEETHVMKNYCTVPRKGD